MKRIINFKVFLLSVFLPAYCMFLSAASVYAQDKIVVIVNNEAVTQKDADDFLNFMSMQLSKEYKGKDLETKLDSLKSGLLNRLIEDRLILQEAKNEKIPVEESRIKARINEAKKRYRSDDDFQRELMSQGLTQADIENKIRDQFLMYGVIDKKVRSKVNVKPEEVTSFYEANKKDFSSGEEREFESFSLENEDLADSLAYNLKIGKSPEDLAGRYPFTMNKFNVLAGEGLKKEIEEAVFGLGVNEVSKVVKVDDKYYVFKLINVVAPKQLPLNEVQYKIQAFLFETKMQEGLVKWLDELKKNSYIKIIDSR
ncbi:MAG: peptidyl-prolyl cis-trans isomerase [Candidatus Omnitrophota bacterium]